MMKKVFVAVAFLLFISVKGIFAQGDVTPQFQASKIYRLPQGEVVNEDLFIAAERVEISGLVNGDVYAAGGQIFIDGQVNGDLLAAGGTINVSGIVMQNLRIVGGQVTLSGRTGRNTSIAGGNIEIIQSAELNRGLAAVFGNFTLNAPVAGYVKAAGGNMTLNNTVNGNVDAAIGVLRVAGKGQVQGDLNYWSGDRASIDDTALITGSVNFNRSTLAVGAPIELAFPTVEISGTVMQLSAKPFSDKLKWHTITLIKNNAYQWEYDAITIGDQYQDGQESVLEILDKQIVTNMMYPIDYYGAYGERSTMSLISQPRYQITVRAKIKVSQTQEGLVYGHEQEIKLGKGMNLSTQNFLFQDFQLAGINTN